MAGSTTPGPLGINPHNINNDSKTTLAPQLQASPIGFDAAAETSSGISSLSEEVRLLAAVVYGESSKNDVFEEMAGIGAVLVRQAEARIYTSVLAFLKSAEAKSFSFVLVDSNSRFQQLKNAKIEEISKNNGMAAAVKAARHAIGKNTDYSAGGYFWDGTDLKSNYKNHPKVIKGIRFTDTKHDIYQVGGKTIPEVVTYWYIKGANGSSKKGKERERYSCTYESTAAYGGTVFWCYTPEYIKATGNKEYQ